MSSLRQFWKRLDGPVHPEDRPIFEKYAGKHTFNLDYPPPAFIGDVDNAPVVVLMSNGGYRLGITEAEFKDAHSIDQYIDYLTGRSSVLPGDMSKYYKSKWGPWIDKGLVAIANAVPYRSPSLSKEKENQQAAKELSSLRVHRAWLMDEVIPEAKQGRRLVLAHRYSWWGIEPTKMQSPCILYSDSKKGEPNRSKPNAEKVTFMEAWLRDLGQVRNAVG